MKHLAFIIVSVTMQSLTFGYVSSRYSYSESLQFTFMAFVLCSVFYYLRTTANNMKATDNEVKSLLFLNVYTAMAFVGFFIAISLIPASIAGLVEAASGPLWALPFSVFILNKKVRLNEIFIGAFFLLIALFVSFSVISKINKNVISGLLLAFAGIVLPLYFLQLGMAKSEPLQTMLCLAAIPSITCVFEWYFGREFDLTAFFLIGSVVGLSVIYMIFESKRKALRKRDLAQSDSAR
ncbi:EamA family transporter [Candidatus Spongiihabitans sp.]|uniref:EamA family transporter n=1 Tax=Candidatus Spongiihabitans sp. TaxID=3101308 RepID=UPI003C7D2777